MNPAESNREVDEIAYSVVSAVIRHLEELPPELVRYPNILLEFVKLFFQSPGQRARNELIAAARAAPELLQHAHKLTQLASKETLSIIKAELVLRCVVLEEDTERFADRCTVVGGSIGLCLFALQVYWLTLPTPLIGLQVITVVCFAAFTGYAVLRILLAIRVIFTFRRWAQLLDLASS